MKSRVFLCAILLTAAMYRPATADMGIGVGVALPGIRIGINVPAYPDLVPVPGYPVYYAPDVDANLFFYDGLYWVFAGDYWYSSPWYDGPWNLVEPDYVPYFLLRVPVSYYRRPPPFFRDWNGRMAPRWDEHWGYSWREHHQDWNRWNRGAIPQRAPLPTYQRRFSGPHYPGAAEQRQLQGRYYRYQPREQQRYGRPGAPQQRPGNQRRPGNQQRPGNQRYSPPQPRGYAPGAPDRTQPQARRQPPMYRGPQGRPGPQAQQQRGARPQQAQQQRGARADGHQPEQRHGQPPRE